VPDDTTRQSVIFNDLFGKPVVARFDQPDASSDGGAVLLKACDVRLNLTQALANCLHDTRQQSKVAHSFHDLIRQRVYGIACGYEDCNDAARIGNDPVHKMLLDRDPIAGAALASQSTLSRFENALGPKSLMRMATALADAVVARHRKRRRGRVRRVIIKAEVVRLAGREPKDNPRFVVTNLRRVPQGAAHRGGLRADAGAALARRAQRLCCGPGHDAARATVQARGMGGALGAPHRHPSSRPHTLALGMVSGRPGTGGRAKLNATPTCTSLRWPNHRGNRRARPETAKITGFVTGSAIPAVRQSQRRRATPQ
jgi:hypothetical protein